MTIHADFPAPGTCEGTADWVNARAKRGFDLAFSVVVLAPCLAALTLCLVLLNPVFNPGPLFYRPVRMGRGCRPFRTWKFRTMTVARTRARGPDDPMETERITRLGRFLRRARFDELPQILNVLAGDMSLIGPRPDDFGPACAYLSAIPGYRRRHSIRPGISGLAQIELGYAEGRDATRAKTALDLRYIASADARLDASIFWRTLRTVFDLKGR